MRNGASVTATIVDVRFGNGTFVPWRTVYAPSEPSYSMSPSMLTLPFLIFSPFALRRSSTVLSLPSSVLS